MPDLLTAEQAAAIALERFGEGWLVQDGPDPCGEWAWIWCPFWWRSDIEPVASATRWLIGCLAQYVGPGHPNGAARK